MPATKSTDDISREEDFRDFEARNIDSGWPYDDAAGSGAKPVGNAAYGQTRANFDRDRNEGFSIDNADFDGQEQRQKDALRPETLGVEDADDLEERITDAISEMEIAQMDAIDLHVESGTVRLHGVVDDAATSRRIEMRTRSVAGVRHVINNLRLAGVDTHIPTDD